MRAIAILSVVGFHAFPYWVKGGFVGVDIFFVISGYLISTIIFGSLSRDAFSFREFYIRRIKRIFPALLLVLITSFALGWFVLLPDEYKQLGKHIAGAAGFVANFILWNESGYFDNEAATKPLLHIWSLGIEEQFYIIFPFLLWGAWKARFNLLTITLVIAILSFSYNIYTRSDTVADFYSPQTRFWELMFGAILAHIQLYKVRSLESVSRILYTWIGRTIHSNSNPPNRDVLNNLKSIFGAGLIALAVIFINEKFRLPGWWAVLPTFGAALMISAGKDAFLNRYIFSNRLMVWIGLISYPLYLWHWLLLSFAHIVESEMPSQGIRISVITLSFLLAWLTYKLIEQPVQSKKHTRAKVVSLVTLMIVVGCVGYRSFSNLDKSQVENIYLQAEAKNNCRHYFPDWDTVTDSPCFLQKKSGNSIAIIGDSHAGILFPGISELLAPSDGVAVFPASCAAPYIDVSTGTRRKSAKERRIRAGNYRLINRAYDYIINDPAIKVVVLAHNPWCSVYDAIDMEQPDNKDNQKVLIDGMRRTFSALIKAKKKVIVLFDTPRIPPDFRSCLRPFTLTKKIHPCGIVRVIDKTPYLVIYRSLVESVLKDYPEVRTLDMSDPFCDRKGCYYANNGILLYGDEEHLNFEGSRYVAPYLLNAIKTMK